MVEVIEESGQLVIRIGGQEYARYQFGSPRWKPYLYPLRAANGLSLLADAPTDHRHHHGFWVGYGRIQNSAGGDADCWLERHNSGRIAARGFENITGGGEQGGFTQTCDWVGPDGEVVLRDTRSFRFYDTPIEARYFDFELTLRAPGNEPVTLAQTNEAGLPHIRVAEGLSAAHRRRPDERGGQKERARNLQAALGMAGTAPVHWGVCCAASPSSIIRKTPIIPRPGSPAITAPFRPISSSSAPRRM